MESPACCTTPGTRYAAPISHQPPADAASECMLTARLRIRTTRWDSCGAKSMPTTPHCLRTSKTRRSSSLWSSTWRWATASASRRHACARRTRIQCRRGRGLSDQILRHDARWLHAHRRSLTQPRPRTHGNGWRRPPPRRRRSSIITGDPSASPSSRRSTRRSPSTASPSTRTRRATDGARATRRRRGRRGAARRRRPALAEEGAGGAPGVRSTIPRRRWSVSPCESASASGPAAIHSIVRVAADLRRVAALAVARAAAVEGVRGARRLEARVGRRRAEDEEVDWDVGARHVLRPSTWRSGRRRRRRAARGCTACTAST